MKKARKRMAGSAGNGLWASWPLRGRENPCRNAGAILAAVLLLGLLFGGSKGAAAGGSSSLGVSASSVNIGDSVTVTLNVSTDVYAAFQMSVSYTGGILEYTGASKNDCNGGGGALSIVAECDGGYSINLNFRAIAPGSASVSASLTEAYAIETAEAVSISGSSASVTVNNAASGGGTGDGAGGAGNTGSSGNGGGEAGGAGNEGGGESGGGSSANLSADNSLKSLTISPGTLSPSFKYNTTKYTANVAEDVTSIAVDAQPSNAGATVESVTGNTDLKPGNNTVSIVVKAENGTLATYTITVNRGGAAKDPEEEDPEEDPEEKPEEDPDTELPATDIVINGVFYEVSKTLPDTELPEEFSKGTATYGGEEVEAYTFPYQSLQLFYLNPITAEGEEEQEGGFYFYNAGANEFFPYINITVGTKYVIVLPSVYSEGIPDRCQDASITLGTATISGCQLMETESTGEFFLVYCVDQHGTAGWYQYDTLDMSLQRYHQVQYIPEEKEEVPEIDTSVYTKAYDELEEKYEKEKASSRIILIVLSVLLAAALVAIVLILIFVKGKNGKGGGNRFKDMDYIDFDDL